MYEQVATAGMCISPAAGHDQACCSGEDGQSRVGRGLDVAASGALILLLLPLLLVVSAAVFIADPGPVFFGHVRLGRGGRAFRCWKFRTMVVDAEARLQALLASDVDARAEWERDHKLRSDPRVTKLGRFLRKSSLDELPQLVNVLLGTMSLVGPRPIVLAEVSRYGRYFADYCRVRPGITGLWQVSGRNDVDYRRRVALDVAYARSKTIQLDIRIVLLTVPCVLLTRGSY